MRFIYLAVWFPELLKSVKDKAAGMSATAGVLRYVDGAGNPVNAVIGVF